MCIMVIWPEVNTAACTAVFKSESVYETAATAVSAMPYCCFMTGYLPAASARVLTETCHISTISSSASMAVMTSTGLRARERELERKRATEKKRERARAMRRLLQHTVSVSWAVMEKTGSETQQQEEARIKKATDETKQENRKKVGTNGIFRKCNVSGSKSAGTYTPNNNTHTFPFTSYFGLTQMERTPRGFHQSTE